VRVITRKTLSDFWRRPGRGDAKEPLKAWLAEAERATWTGPADIKRGHATASFVGTARVVFNIGGNKYRLIVHVRYRFFTVYIRFVGTHAEYDKVNAEEV